MNNYNLAKEEVILYKGNVSMYEGIDTSNKRIDNIDLTLTTLNIILEKKEEKKLFKTIEGFTDIISLKDIKIYNDKVQVSQKGSDVSIQTVSKNITLAFFCVLEARKFTEKAINELTGTTTIKRGANKVKGAIDLVDDVLGLDSRGVVNGIMKNGIKGTLINGFKNKKK